MLQEMERVSKEKMREEMDRLRGMQRINKRGII